MHCAVRANWRVLPDGRGWSLFQGQNGGGPTMNSVIRSRSQKSVRYACWLVPTFIVLALAAGWAARAPILHGMAKLWVVSDPLEHADAIVILGGRLDVRPFAAADLYKRGLADRVLVSNVKSGPIDKLLPLPRQTELNRQILHKLGVPEQAIVDFGNGVANTYQEARAVFDWARISGVKSLIIPTDIFASRRDRWIFGHELAPIGVRVMGQYIDPPEYSLEDWWRHESGVIEFQNEVIKFVYYRLKY